MHPQWNNSGDNTVRSGILLNGPRALGRWRIWHVISGADQTSLERVAARLETAPRMGVFHYLSTNLSSSPESDTLRGHRDPPEGYRLCGSLGENRVGAEERSESCVVGVDSDSRIPVAALAWSRRYATGNAGHMPGRNYVSGSSPRTASSRNLNDSLIRVSNAFVPS